MPNPDQIRVVGGHFLGVSVEPRFKGRELNRTLLLRDPVSHFVSYYNFRMMRYLSQGLNPYSFELAYGATQRNFITHYILRNFLEIPWPWLTRFSDEEKYAVVNAFLASFWYVADYAYCDDLIATLAKKLEISARAPARNTCGERTCSISDCGRRGARLGTKPLEFGFDLCKVGPRRSPPSRERLRASLARLRAGL
jgi:hypothetical protein